MPIRYKKIVVTADELSFEPGVILGLDTGKKNKLTGYVKQLKDGATLINGEFELIVGVSFNKGEVLWVDEKSLPQSGDGSFRVVPMAKSYQECLVPNPTPNSSARIGGSPQLMI